MNTIKSTIRLEDVDEAQVRQCLKHLKKIEDIPYSKACIERKADGTMLLIIDYPMSVFDKTVTQFIAVLFGEMAFIRSFGKLKFIELDLPEEVYGWFGGPAFGAGEIGKRFGIEEFPLLVGIVKPSLGPSLNIAAISNKISDALRGGIHAVKDDEMQGNLPFACVADRIRLAENVGRYIPTLNYDSTQEYKKVLQNKRIGMALINASIIGFPMLNSLRKVTNVPLLSHVAMQGTYQSSFSPKVFAQLHRLFGCDAFITPIGDVDYYRTTKDEEGEMVDELVKELPIMKTLPLLTGGARLSNLEKIMSPYQSASIPYGIVFGTAIYGSGGNAMEKSREIVERVRELNSQRLVH